MAANSSIEWTTHTFNPWWGCVKVSPACKHCYAESWAKRVGSDVWGIGSERRFFSDNHWKSPEKWNEKSNPLEPDRVFCASMADVFEARDDVIDHRFRLFSLIEKTDNLVWLLLTKRIENVTTMVPWGHHWPDNVWLGTTVEDQRRADERLPVLADIPARVKFISAEPLLSPVSIEKWLDTTIDWVITGGESGPKARPSSPTWFRSLMNQCMERDIPFHFKQWGDWAPGDGINMAKARKQLAADGTVMYRVGKKMAGRSLDGSTWDQLPKRA